jgi:Na+-translocating ferredoxin:NAD+ oxidoreductase RnfC subunit
VIQAILGELPMTGGQVDVHGDISYSPQESWVFAGTSIKALLQHPPEDQIKQEEEFF